MCEFGPRNGPDDGVVAPRFVGSRRVWSGRIFGGADQDDRARLRHECARSGVDREFRVAGRMVTHQSLLVTRVYREFL